MALALYRRYRPDTFDKVIGQDQVTVPLMRALDEGRLTHAYLFSGPRGCGKTSSARIMARCINCEQGPTSHPCGKCDSCRDLSATGGGSIDVMEIDAASHNGVEDARQLRDSVLNPPVRDRYKIIILDEAHMVTPQGFNALLKTVEEPPERVMFIFATTEPEKVIGTIRSRTHHYPFRLVPPEIMGPYLEQVCAKEQMEPEAGVLKLAMRAGGGSVRDTLSVLDQLMTGAVDGRITYASATALLGFTPDAMIGEAIDAVIERDGAKLYGVVEKVAIGGYEPRRFVEDLLARVRDLLVLSLAGQKAESVLSDTAEAEDLDDLKRQAKALGLARLNRMAEKINATLSTMAGAISPRMRLELLAASLLTEDIPASAATPSNTATPAGQASEDNAVAAPRMGFIGSKRRMAEQRTAPAPNRANQAAAMTGSQVDASSPAPSHPAPTATAQAPAASTTDWVTNPGATVANPAEGTRRRPHPTGAANDMATNPQPQPQESISHAAPVAPAGPHDAQGATSAPGAATSRVPDTRTVQERWQEVLALLSEQARQYVDASKVPHVAVNEAPDRSVGKVILTFSTAIAQHTFALAVDGANGKLPKVVLEAVRKVFGARYKIAPSGVAANGEHVEPVNKMPPERQAEIRRQIALAAAKQLATQLPGMTGLGTQNLAASHEGGPRASAGNRQEAQSPAADSVASADDAAGDDEGGVRHDGPAHPALTVALPDDVDPWEHPEVIPTQGGSFAAGTSGAVGEAAHQGMDGVDAQAGGQGEWAARNPIGAQRGAPSGRDGAPPVPTEPFGQMDSTVPVPSVVPAATWGASSDTGPDAWEPVASARPNGPTPSGDMAAPAPADAMPMAATVDPDAVWGASSPAPAVPQGVMPSSVRPTAVGPASTAPVSMPADQHPADLDDESAYSMDDASINDGQVDLDTIKKMFDVKQVEVITPDGDGDNQ